MKTKRIILAIVLSLLMAGGVGSLKAQENLNALMKKCETAQNVNVEALFEKNPKTKKPTRNMTTVTFFVKDNSKLQDEFLEAFQKDRNAAYKVIEDKKNGKIIPSFYRFAAGTTDITYTFEIEKNGSISVTRIERFDFDYDKQFG